MPDETKYPESGHTERAEKESIEDFLTRQYAKADEIRARSSTAETPMPEVRLPSGRTLSEEMYNRRASDL